MNCVAILRTAGSVRVAWSAAILVCGLAFVSVPVAAQVQIKRPEHVIGLIGDGVADDTAALQRAIDKGQGAIILTRGTYRINKTLVVDLDRVGWTSFSGYGVARIVMAGEGPAIRFVGTHGGTASPLTVKPEVWDRQRMPTVDGLEIVGDHELASGIEATGTMQLTICRVNVRDCLHAVHLTGRNRNVTLSECHLYNNRGIGVYMENLDLHQVDIANCHISYNKQGGIVVRGSSIRNLQIGSCDIEANMDENGPPTANVLFDCTNGTMREGALVGCTIQHSRSSAGSANVRFIGQSREVALKVGNFAIADNSMSDATYNIHLQYARGVTITGNTLWCGEQYDLLAEGSSKLVVVANLIDRNPDYRPDIDPRGVLFRDCQDCTVSANSIVEVHSRPGALVLDDCRWINVTGCTVFDSKCCGILLRNSRNCRVADCMVRSGSTEAGLQDAIRVQGGRFNDVKPQNNTTVGAVIVPDQERGDRP